MFKKENYIVKETVRRFAETGLALCTCDEYKGQHCISCETWENIRSEVEDELYDFTDEELDDFLSTPDPEDEEDEIAVAPIRLMDQLTFSTKVVMCLLPFAAVIDGLIIYKIFFE